LATKVTRAIGNQVTHTREATKITPAREEGKEKREKKIERRIKEGKRKARER